MNVKDVPSPGQPDDPLDIPALIVARQKELESQYWLIEQRPSLVMGFESREAQAWIKDFLWRITEEVGETLESIDKIEDPEKIKEEVADGLHFVTGLCIISGHDHALYHAWVGWLSDLSFADNLHPQQSVYNLVLWCGVLGNTLKLKPWKQTDVTTDPQAFARNLNRAILAYLRFASSVGHTPQTLFDYYWRKSEVNLFRQRSMY